jgi:hypothetical protein
MGLDKQFGEPIPLVMDNVKRRPVVRLPMNLGSSERWKNLKVSMWSRGSH